MKQFFATQSSILAVLFICSNAHAQQAMLSCEAIGKRGYITGKSLTVENDPLLQASDGVTIVSVEVSSLIEYGKPDEQGIAQRLRSKSKKQSCGPFTVSFSASWFNDDPNGAGGGDVLAVVELYLNGKSVAGPFSLGPCSFTCQSPSHQDDPTHWATSIRFLWGEDYARPTLLIERSYTERREIR